VNIEIAQRIIDSKPTEAQHIYVDEAGHARDKHIENLFRDLFNGVPLDATFRNNFEVFFQELIADHDSKVKPGIFLDAAYAKTWIDAHIGIVTVKPVKRSPDASDPDLARVRYSARIKSPYAKRVPIAYAPSMLHATLLAAVFVFRVEAEKRLNTFFAEAIKQS
jgi:hypothetical protein